MISKPNMKMQYTINWWGL